MMAVEQHSASDTHTMPHAADSSAIVASTDINTITTATKRVATASTATSTAVNDANNTFGSVEDAVAAFRRGEFVVVADDTDRENEGDLIIAAEHVTEAKAAFMIRHTSGMICVSVDAARLAELELPQMVAANNEALRTAYTITADYRHGTTTGISAHDRALTIRKLVDPTAVATDFVRPGHVFPLRPVAEGTVRRGGHTEAGFDLCRLAGLRRGAALAELVLDDGRMQRRDDMLAFARTYGLATLTIRDLAEYCRRVGVPA